MMHEMVGEKKGEKDKPPENPKKAGNGSTEAVKHEVVIVEPPPEDATTTEKRDEGGESAESAANEVHPLHGILKHREEETEGGAGGGVDGEAEAGIVVEEPEVDRPKTHHRLGVLFSLSAVVCFAVSTFLVNILLGLEYSPYLCITWRFVGIFVPSIPVLLFFRLYLKKDVLGKVWPLAFKRVNWQNWKNVLIILARSVMGTTGFIFQYSALNYISVGETSVIAYSASIFVLAFGYCCLHEKCGWFPVFAALVTVTGVMLIARPSFLFQTTDAELEKETHKLKGLSYGLAAMICTALTIIALRALKDVNFTVIPVIFGIVGMITGTALSLGIQDSTGSHTMVLPRETNHTLLFLALAVLSCMCQTFVTLALKFEEAATVSIILSLDCVVSFILEAMTGIKISAYSIGGGIIVISAVALIALRTYLMNKRDRNPNDRWVRKLFFVLY